MTNEPQKDINYLYKKIVLSNNLKKSIPKTLPRTMPGDMTTICRHLGDKANKKTWVVSTLMAPQHASSNRNTFTIHLVSIFVLIFKPYLYLLSPKSIQYIQLFQIYLKTLPRTMPGGLTTISRRVALVTTKIIKKDLGGLRSNGTSSLL